jgi:O-antigen/teichoic acid export membrane protein
VHLQAQGALVPLFLVLWVIAALLDRLPSVDERVSWQSGVIVSLATVRLVVVGLTAAATGAIGPVIVALIAFALLKLMLLAWYVGRHHSVRAPIARHPSFVEQVKYAAPVGLAGAVYALRTQADQWVAAALFSLGAFAAFSIAAVLLPLMNLFRQSVNYAFLPDMSRRESTGDIRGMLDMNSHANVTVAAVVCPVFAFAFVCAEDLVTLVYTSTYVGAAPVMRVYIVGLAALVLELSTVTMLLRLAPFVLVLNGVALAAAVPLNFLLAQQVGLAGAAMGSVALLYVDRLITLWRISRAVDLPIAQLQSWRALFEPLLYAIVAALAAWMVTRQYVDSDAGLLRLLLGGIVLAAVYGGSYGWVLRRRTAKRQARE